MREVERLCQRVVFMRRGKIVDDATPKELLKRYGRKNLEDVFIDVARGQARQKALEDAL
jgi:ABC-2 type transport system ATP-binding protein